MEERSTLARWKKVCGEVGLLTEADVSRNECRDIEDPQILHGAKSESERHSHLLRATHRD